MCVAIVGGVKGIERNYKDILKKYGIKCKLFNKKVPEFTKKIKNVDAIILFTNTVSHKMSKECCRLCKKNKITLKRPHSSSLCRLEEVVKDLSKELI